VEISLDYSQALSEMKEDEKEKSSFEYLSKLYTSYLKEYDLTMNILMDDYILDTTGMEVKYMKELDYIQANIDYSNEKIIKIEYYNTGVNNEKMFSIFTINTVGNYLEYNDSDLGKVPNPIYKQHIIKITDSNGELHVDKIQ